MTRSPLPVMLFAAGFGTRMGELTRDRPKPMIPLGGRPLIDRALDLITLIDPPRVVVNTHYKAEVLEQHLDGRGVLISREDPEILDTGGGLKQALNRLDSPVVITMNPDVVWDGPNPLPMLLEQWEPDRMDALLACIPLQRAVGRIGGGDFDVGPDRLISRHGDYVYGGAQILKVDDLADIDKNVFSLNDVWDMIGRRSRLYASIYPGRWCDVGTPDGLALAENLVAEDV